MKQLSTIDRAPVGATAHAQAGFTLIEILVTILILLVGLLGVFGMQTRATKTEFESYQRGQALALARDMEARIAGSRGILAGYLDNSVSSTSTDGSVFLGYGAGNFAVAGNCVPPAAGNDLQAAQFEACQWGQALEGVAEQAVAASGPVKIGAMLGAKGCLMRVEPATQNALADLYIVVVWQGVVAGTEPPADSPAGRCASAFAFGPGLRRGLSLRVLVPDLAKAV